MKTISNSSKKNIVYKGKVLPPNGVLLLNDDGSIIESVEAESALTEAKKYTDEVMSKASSNAKKNGDDTLSAAKKYADEKFGKIVFDFDKDEKSLNITVK